MSTIWHFIVIARRSIGPEIPLHYKGPCSRTDIPLPVPGLRLTDMSEGTVDADAFWKVFRLFVQRQRESENQIIAVIADWKTELLQHVVSDSFPQGHLSPDDHSLREPSTESERKRPRQH